MKNPVIIFGSSSSSILVTQRYLHTTQPKLNPSLTNFSNSRPSPSPSPSPQSSSSFSSSTTTFDSTSPHISSRLQHYADLASKLAENGRSEEFSLIVETFLVSRVNASRFAAMLNLELIAKGVSRNLREGKVNSVIDVMIGIDKLGVSPLNLFDGPAMDLMRTEIRRMVNSGEVEEIVGLVETLAGFNFRIKELVDPFHVIKICADNCKPDMAIRYAFLLPHAHMLFCKIIHEFGRKGDLISAMKAYEASKQNLESRNMYIVRKIIDVCGFCGDYMKSRYIYEDLLEQNITPNIYVFNSLMSVNAHDLEYSLSVYKTMQNLGLKADMASYNVLLKACCLARRVDLAQDIYKEAKQLELEGRLKLDVFTYCTVIKVFADAKLWQMALQIKEDMQSANVIPNTITWSSLINACANAGLVEKAMQLFEEMLQSGCEPNSQCCNIILHACVEACQYDRVFRLFQSWRGSTVPNTSSENYWSTKDSNSYSKKTIEKGFISGFSKRFPFIPTTTTYNILLKACGTDYHRAKALLDEMKAVGLQPNHISWSTLIDICGCSGNAEGAIQILKTMRIAGTEPDVIAYTTAIKVCVECKKLKLAFSLFEEMKRYRIHPNLVTYNTLLRARSRYGSLREVQQCLAIYQDMRKAGYRANDYYLKGLIEEWCEGVIQHNDQTKLEKTSSKGANSFRPESLLLEKVAAHLQKSADCLAIDLQGLTKVEGRIVVLAVLRRIKENHTQGEIVKDDMLIIIGFSKVYTDNVNDVKEAVISILQDQLGLEVRLAGPSSLKNTKVNMHSMPDSEQSTEENQRLQVVGSSESVSSTRRPVILQRLIVTKESLNRWLRRKIGVIQG